MTPDIIANASAINAAKKACKEIARKVEEARLALTTAGVKPFELYSNLLSDKARQSWENILKAQVTQAPWEDVFRIPHTKTPTKSWSSFHECLRFHLQIVFDFDA